MWIWFLVCLLDMALISMLCYVFPGLSSFRGILYIGSLIVALSILLIFASRCPSCNRFLTLGYFSTTVQATLRSEGKRHHIHHCSNCSYRRESEEVIPKLKDDDDPAYWL